MIRFSIYKVFVRKKLKTFCFSYSQALSQKEVFTFKYFKTFLCIKKKRILAKFQIKFFCILRNIFEQIESTSY